MVRVVGKGVLRKGRDGSCGRERLVKEGQGWLVWEGKVG
jgi:hypothetical protein